MSKKASELPQGWTDALLDEVTERGSGHTPDKERPDYWNGGIKWVSLADGRRLDRRYITETAKEISELGIRHSSAVVHPRGTVILLRDADVGRCGILGNNMAVSQHFIAWRCAESGPLFNEFLYYQLQLRKREFERVANGSTIPTIGLSFFRSFHVCYPGKPEQKRIAEVLRTWDEAVEITGRLIAAKEKRISWLRMELLTGKRRLPGQTTRWNAQRLGEILNEHGLKSSGEEAVFSVSVHKGLINQIEHLGRSFAAKETGHYNRVNPGDIVYTKSPTGDFPLGIIKRSKIDRSVIVSPLYGVFTPVNPHIGVLLDAYFESPVNTRNYLAPLVQKGAKNTIAITNKRFLEGRVNIPSDVGEQAALADLVSTTKAEIDALRVQYKLLERQKRGLLQKLLTGKWRVLLRDCESLGLAERVTQELIS
jgi:type I restriction enzyme S subunit